eukprot:GHVU01123442.1.p1 GENE.GHVU01123442.1~~GHVU01123442.1.p1  ORF type:complete len:108 (-),score=6.80 GHVU01123442.1:603-926(-)
MGVALERNLPPVTSVVFSGQGEPADNVEALQHAEQMLTDPGAFRLSRRRLTLSTIGMLVARPRPPPPIPLSLPTQTCTSAHSREHAHIRAHWNTPSDTHAQPPHTQE